MLLGYKTFTQVKEDIKKRSRETLDAYIQNRDTSSMKIEFHKTYSEAKNKDYYSKLVSQFAERHPFPTSSNLSSH